MILTKKFELWKAQAAVTLMDILGVAILAVAIPEAAIPEAAIPGAILGVATLEVATLGVATLGAIQAGRLAGAIQGAEGEFPMGEGRTLKTIPKCSR